MCELLNRLYEVFHASCRFHAEINLAKNVRITVMELTIKRLRRRKRKLNCALQSRWAIRRTNHLAWVE